MKKIRVILKYVFIVLIVCQAIMCVKRSFQEVQYLWNDKAMTSWATTDYLVNYHGGFVRRGMFGEILYQLRLNFGIDTLTLLTILTVVCFVILVYLFVKSFHKRGLKM